MSAKRRDGFIGEKQINIPKTILSKHIKKKEFLHSLFITHIGYFPKALYHYRERKNGCEDYILLYSLGGKGYIENAEEKFELAPNQFIIIPPHQYHRFQADINDPWTIYWVHFSSNKLNELNKEFNVEQYYKPTDIFYDEKIIDVWFEMYSSLASEYSTTTIGYANFCLYRFLSFFFFPNNKFNILEQECPLDQSIEYMKANIDKRLTADIIANQFQYSSSHYTAIFKKKTGSSPIDYFINMKIHFACQLLSQSELKIREIAEKVGYDDPYYFSRLFKQIMNKSPKEYREVI
ncbi:AraC family transcriptional regulator [Chitinophagaceae bacterium LB-8]|uniref:AraC family transcriptional regulator n=1 Tax=Paraflavisolibacter caeni TaxID=2982496 RepID=A0A9X3BHJ1_9BACT|nr:AraC family transcriptional regulator [Paraflavisolibacter caeni]MCU7548828.1 AraC family transcriptional regulator [Paraflavisolibacter caeni]